jgi:phosphoglycerate dehydrogenase-like enzyme
MELANIRKNKTVIAGKGFPASSTFLKKQLPDIDLKAVDPKELFQEIKDANVLIPGMTKIESELLGKASSLMLIQQWGAGLEGVDIKSATKYKIPVANVPTEGTGNAESVAEWYIMAVLNLCRKEYETRFYGEKYSTWGSPIGKALYGKTAGLLGFGGIGKALARRLKAFQMKIIALQRNPDYVTAKKIGLEWIGRQRDLPEFLKQTDFLFLCLPLNKSSFHLINKETISLLPTGACILNAARGAIIEKEALIDALQNGHIGGAALDVFWEEPFKPNDPIKYIQNVFLTPHIAGVTDYSYQGISNQVAKNILRVHNGFLPNNCVNPEVKPKWLKEDNFHNK